ncbi:reductase [Rhodococcus sp. 06-462-5]|uniref:bifunctional nitrate reductase/sulfite reductase flavoprotein subunit alpha n=1 Tax=unclassified Rhodococcus (in: high G+C Gram-positive bacteria) TaxID=192944 RepID=UPI000B9AB710|nr:MULTISPECIES: bifunctional nitrate reductase/sulfite reductase flavoprotein subunit alpha [unclassified Rhodococcus (in: high G+C Gram-positive bacteria)]OZC76258.1 reductase [Rhodococcus sp. 06-462-5]OZE57947.1 reductase [Rhodococcus sp. 02-925g]
MVTTVKTLCAYCGVGCGMVLEIGGPSTSSDAAPTRPVVTKSVGDKSHPANFGRLCTKGTTTADMLAGPGRLEKARIRHRRGERPESMDTAAAINDTARRLRAIIDEHGPDALALYVSGQMSIEAQYLSNKLAKGFIGTNQIESNSRLCMASAGTGYKQSLGADGPPGSYEDFDHADVFFVIGSNMADCHPILFLRMMDRVKAGAKLIVVDPRRTATADKAHLHLQLEPGSDLALLNGLLALIVENGDIDPEFIAEFTDGWDAMPEFLGDYTPEKVCTATGLDEQDLRAAAAMIGGAENWMSCWTMGLNQSTHGTWNTNALCNLHLATGAICRTGSGPFSLTGQPNAMGGREMGYMGPGLPGQRAVVNDADREFVEDRWGVPRGTLRTDVGGGTIEMFSKLAAGEIKACWIICTNPVASVANRTTVIDGLERAELVITQDAFADTETNEYADVMLPAALWTEAHGVMVNSERNLTLFQPALEAPGGALPDWKIIADMACALGFADAFTYASAEEVFEEIKQFWNPNTGYDIRGVTYERLRESPIQWPCPPDASTTRHPIRYLNDGVSQRQRVSEDGAIPALSFPTPSGRAQFFARPSMAPAEMPDDDFPFLLNTGRLPHQWHTMTKTGKVAKLNKLDSGPFVEVHPLDADRLGVIDGDSVEVASRRGRAVLPAVVTDRVLPGSCFAPFHWNDEFGEYLAINAVTNDAIDPYSQQPEFKACAVTLTRVAADRSPSPVDDEHSLDPVDALATIVGRPARPSEPLTTIEQRYIAGLLEGLGSEAGRSAAGTPTLPSQTPLSPETHAWLDGVLAGLFSRGPDTDGAISGVSADTADPGGRSVLLLWASQTGTAEEYAQSCLAHLRGAGLTIAEHSMDTFTVDRLPAEADVLIVSSTTGDGEAPDNGATFWDSLVAESAAKLPGIRYAVLAFGDSSYADFCGHGRRIDERLSELGGRRLLERVDCEPDYESEAAAWLDAVVDLLRRDDDTTTTEGARVESARTVPQTGAEPERYSKKSPLVTTLVRNRVLTARGSVKDVRQFGFHLPDGTLEYEVGDALGVWPRNSDAYVDEWLTATGLDSDAAVDLAGYGSMSLRTALSRHLEIARATPDLLKFVHRRTADDDLEAMLHPDNKHALSDWMWGRQSIDVLAAHPVRASVDDWLGVLKPLQPRLYSISSSPKENPNEVQVTVSAVRYNVHGVPRRGVCSTYLADHASNHDVGIFVQKTSHFKPPDDPTTPMIMVGPGTGVAPFRAFLHERRALGHTGHNWLFFGEQHADTDFYYRDELTAMLSDGSLNRLDVAFSRDQKDKVYVQDRMREHGAELWNWIHRGAHFYVCGDASRMAKDVDAALKGVVAQHGKLAPSSAEAYVKALAAEKRYVRDVY